MILAGGAARRAGGVAKPAVQVGGRSRVGRVLDAVAGVGPRVVVGPPELAGLLPAGVILTRERPPGGGPVAAVAAGLAPLSGRRGLVAILAADLPFLDPATMAALRRA